jgi:hypothetical protein
MLLHGAQPTNVAPLARLLAYLQGWGWSDPCPAPSAAGPTYLLPWVQRSVRLVA